MDVFSAELAFEAFQTAPPEFAHYFLVDGRGAGAARQGAEVYADAGFSATRGLTLAPLRR
jgi:hypothetical protein